MTSHNSLFGWIHSFKINHNNLLLGSSANRMNPYPALIPNPTVKQCFQNWNAADTGVFLFTLAASSILLARMARKNPRLNGYF
jgi:type IV secretory pathway TrbD component